MQHFFDQNLILPSTDSHSLSLQRDRFCLHIRLAMRMPFLKPILLAISILGFSLTLNATPINPDDWSQTVKQSLHCLEKAEEGDATIEVELFKPSEQDLTEVKNAEGDSIGYAYQGKRLPSRFWPGCNLIRKFELTWQGRKIDIPERFWADLVGCIIEQSSLQVAQLPDELKDQGETFLQRLQKPRLYVSADGGTVLIEWQRHEECNGASTIRWIVSKSGTVLRHRHEPPHDC